MSRKLYWLVLIVLVIAVAAAIRLNQTPADPAEEKLSQTDLEKLAKPGAVTKNSDGIPCRSGDVLAGVYHPYRLKVVSDCQLVTGTVSLVRHEEDGDYHINIKPDKPYANLINDVNRQKQKGGLVVEVIPADRNRVATPKAGEHVTVVGAYVLDEQHGGWAEIHPAWVIEQK